MEVDSRRMSASTTPRAGAESCGPSRGE